VYKGHFLGQAARVDEMGECGTTQDGQARTFARVGSVSLLGQHTV